MPILEAEAVVLRSYSLSDADRIVVLATREYGKVRVVGQGVKKPKSRMAGCLEPLTHIRAKFFLREGAELWRLRQCEGIHSYLGSKLSLRQFYGFSYIAELVHEYLEDHNPNPPLFRLLLSVLATGEERGCSEALVRYFELWLLRLCGLLPDYRSCSNCGRVVVQTGFYAAAERGEGCCEDCAGGKGLRIRPAAAKFLQSYQHMSPLEFAEAPGYAPAAPDLEKLTLRLIERSLEKTLKSYSHLRQTWREDGTQAG
ncbi:MAG: replication and repair protein RecO [Acidobacteria bacterium]|nr:replication and repair protein RecO [Acidobacteriota bacterium]